MSDVYISALADERLKAYLRGEGHNLIQIEDTGLVYEEVASHPDIYMCKLGAQPEDPVFVGDREKLGFKYPANIRYNAAVCGKYFIHNLKYTAPELLEAAKQHIGKKYAGATDTEAVTFINVPQGYTRCNIVVVDDSHIITEDVGIAKAIDKAMQATASNSTETAEDCRIKVLLIEPKQVKLPGFKYGFIGGASGRIGDEIIFNGDLAAHSDFKKIKEFIEGCGLKLKYFEEYPLTDIGSIIESA